MTGPVDDKATIEVELEDALSREAVVAAKSAEEMAREIRTLNRQLLMLDKRALKAATSIGVLDAAMTKFNGNAKDGNTVLDSLNKTTAEYRDNVDKATKATSKNTTALTKQNRQVKKNTSSFRQFFKILDLGGKGLRPHTLAILALGTALAGGIAPAFQLGAAVSSLAGFLVALPAAIDVLLLSLVALGVGFKGIGEGISAALGDDWQAFYDAQKDLAPEAQHFLKVLRKYRGAFKEVRMSVQSALFEGFSDKLKPLLEKQVPIFKTGMTNIARIAGQTFGDVFTFFTSEKGGKSVEVLFRNAENLWRNIKTVAMPIMEGFADLVISTEKSFDKMTNTVIGKWGTQFGAWLTKISENGQAAMWLENAMIIGGQLVEIFQTFGRILLDISEAAGGMSTSPLASLLDLIEGFTSSAEGQEALRSFFESMRQVVSALAPVVVALGSAIGTVLAPILADIITELAPYVTTFIEELGAALEMTAPMWPILAQAIGQVLVALTPLLPLLATLISYVGVELANILKILAPILQLLLTALAGPLTIFFQTITTLLIAQAPFLQRIFEMIGRVLERVGPIIEKVGEAFMTHLLAFIEKLIPLWEEQLPLIEEFITLLGDGFLSVLEQLAPMLPDIFESLFELLSVFTDPLIISAILSFMKYMIFLVKIFVQILPWIVMFVSWLIRGAKLFIEWATWLAHGVLDGIRRFKEFLEFFAGIADQFRAFLDPIIDIITTPFRIAFNAVADLWNSTIGQLSWEVPSWVPGIGGSKISAPKIPKLETGGPALAGQKYMVGEAGKEMFFPNDGGEPQMIGERGTEYRTFDTSGFVMPNSMVRAMERANEGMVKELARMEGAHSDGAVRSAERAMAMAGGGDTYNNNIEQHFHNANMTPRDVERAVERALRKAEQDRKERS